MTTPNRSVLALLLGSIACATTTPTIDGTTAASASRGGTSGLNECGLPPGEVVKVPADAPLSEVVRSVACGNRVERDEAVLQRWYVRRHFEYDEATTNPAEVAAMILTCVADGSCDPAVDGESFGYMQAYAHDLDLPSVEKALVREARPAVAAAFLARTKAARLSLEEAGKKLDSRRRDLFVDLPRSVRAERLQHQQAVAGFDGRVRDLLAEVDSALLSVSSGDRLKTLAGALVALRNEVLQKCAAQLSLRECFDGAIVRPLTERLVTLAIELRDAPLATAEYQRLAEGEDRSTLYVQLGRAMAVLHAENQARVGRYEKEKAAGSVDPVTLEIMFGAPPPQRLPELAWAPAVAPIDYSGRIAALAATERIEGTVRSSRGRGGALEIAFEERAPVIIALDEARLLRIGEKLEAIVDRQSRRGVVVYAKKTRPERIVQVGGMRVAAR